MALPVWQRYISLIISNQFFKNNLQKIVLSITPKALEKDLTLPAAVHNATTVSARGDFVDYAGGEKRV